VKKVTSHDLTNYIGEVNISTDTVEVFGGISLYIFPLNMNHNAKSSIRTDIQRMAAEASSRKGMRLEAAAPL
jgi:hypothetical protein